MDKLLDEIESYWSTRTEGYSEVNEKELKGMQKKAWLETLERGFFGKRSGKNEDSENNSVEKEVFEEEFSEKQHTDKYKDHLRILDIGTGPGFFPMILAEAGYHVTAIDYTPGMLEKAAENAAKFIGEKSRNIEFKRMDAQALEFEDESFDVIISRNLTWNLPHPEMAYKEWLRVLKKGGKLLNFDAYVDSLPNDPIENFTQRCDDWIRCWGNGGGDLSTETVLREACKVDKSNNPRVLARALYESIVDYTKTSFDAASMVSTVINECLNEE